MKADCFIDSNILFYAAMGRYSEPVKYHISRDVMANNHFGVSGQVLAEFFVNVTRKSDKPLTVDEALGWLEDLKDRPCTAIDNELVMQAVNLSRRYMISYWDAALIAAARRMGASILYTEDLNHGQTYGSVRVVNPFYSN
jgi:predicted nucleic acid-binding protein